VSASFERPIKLTIAALGGQGGGVLTDWLVEIAQEEGYLAQTTSVPGVAQRTGATIYYLEFFPRAEAERRGREPIMALMPAPGDVDCVLASELAEAGRAVQRGLVTPDRTTLIASSHRSYAIGEKMAMGRGPVDSAALTDLVREHAKRLILFDMNAMAEQHRSVISSVLLGALGGSGVLPFRKESFAAAIKKSGIAVATNLAAFEDAFERAARGDMQAKSLAPSDGFDAVPAQARSPQTQPLLDRVRKLPAAIQPVVLAGVRRSLDYQDVRYAELYLQRVDRVLAIETARAGANDFTLAEATARGLALWMTFEDTIRVADLKTRAARFARLRGEVVAPAGQIIGITEFMKPRVAEIAGTMPVGLGRWVLRSPGVSRWLERRTGGKKIRTSTISGFLFLHMLGGMKRWRRGTLRYQEENARIEEWLERIERLAATDYALAVELARAQRLIKGYGETHERGWRNYTRIVAQLDKLAQRKDGAAVLARLQDAALADEEGKALAAQLALV
jgi:indolepyruvate ferredoxin oxidoreductase beta subunit